VSLAFFSTFEPVNLTPNSVMQQEGVPMFYDSASCTALPCLYICPVKNVLGRVPMIPCFVAGNTQPTIPHRFARGGRAVLGAGAADTRPDSGNGSRLYELHLWMWRYGRGQVRKVSVTKAMEARVKRLREARARAGATSGQAPSRGAGEGGRHIGSSAFARRGRGRAPHRSGAGQRPLLVLQLQNERYKATEKALFQHIEK